MDPSSLEEHLLQLSIPKNHVSLGLANLISQSKSLCTLLKHKKMPNSPLSDLHIQSIILTLSSLDTNRETPCIMSGHSSSDQRWIGVGEREGRIYSTLVSQRNFGLGHGMGRSGDIMEPQPKAVGSSVMVQLTKLMVLDVMRRGAGLRGDATKKEDGPVKHGIVLPLCTGMSIALVLSSLRESAEDSKNVVLWSRIDQKTCFKAVISAGFKCVVVPTRLDGDQVVTDVMAMKAALEKYKDRVIAIITTTSCFAPRVPDQVDIIAKLCQEEKVHHVINNAYGLQCHKTVKLINRACAIGRVDAMICSTDKNFLVPVGGAIVSSPHASIIENVSKIYAGRASSAPILDLFITLLSMGLSGYSKLLEERKSLVSDFGQKFQEIAEKYGERLLICTDNTISFGITLDTLSKSLDGESCEVSNCSRDTFVSMFGSMLFTRCVSGTRAVARNQNKTIAEQKFVGFGSSHEDFPHSYLTAACTIGLTRPEMDEFFVRLDKCFKDMMAKRRKELEKVTTTTASRLSKLELQS
jgi:O-phospho-L-seryl-tRNASec:L-selenocysteinyl-tRNA synthase